MSDQSLNYVSVSYFDLEIRGGGGGIEHDHHRAIVVKPESNVGLYSTLGKLKHLLNSEGSHFLHPTKR